MTAIWKWRGSMLAAALVSLLVGRASAQELLDRVMAIVEGDIITQSDVRTAIEFGFVDRPQNGDPYTGPLAQLVDRGLILAEVDRYAPPEPSAAALDGGLAAIRARFGSPAAFSEALARTGASEERLRALVRDSLRRDAYLNQRFSAPVQPTEEELGVYFREHQGEFARAGRPLTFEDARPQVFDRVMEEHRRLVVADWVAGLRRRAELSQVYRAVK